MGERLHSALSDVRQLEVELHRDWILVTYDIPRGQDAERKRVIRALRSFGALKHTDSVYYLPASKKAIEVAATLPGEVYVWRSSPTSDNQAKGLTQNYYSQIVEGVNELEARLGKLQEGWSGLTVEARKQKMSYSLELFNNLEAAANNLGLIVYQGLADVGQMLAALREKIWGAV